MSLTTLEKDYVNLTPSLKDYFEHLSGDATMSDPIDFFEKVPSELRSDSSLVEKYLNGDADLGITDKDWSHIESKFNGGSNEADNGFFEDMSDNRSRQSANTSTQDVYEQALEDEAEVTILGDIEDTMEATTVVTALEGLASTLTEFSMDVAAPLVGGALAGKAIADRCDTMEQKVVFGGGGGLATALLLTTPIGQTAVLGYVGYRLVKKGAKLVQKHIPA